MKLGLVTPWFGRNLHGGAERLAVDLADAFAGRGHEVTVFTTCSRDWRDPWDRNTLAPGRSTDGSIRIERFRVDRTNTGAFREVNRAILSVPRSRLIPGGRTVDETTEAAFVAQNISSTALLAELVRSSASCDRIIFLPYLYGTTLRGWHIPRERTAIIPCLHDEAYAYLGPVDAMMRGAPLLLFNSVGEYEIARRLYGPSIDQRAVVVGSAIDAPQKIESRETIAGFDPEGSRYVLFLGRNRPEKNIELLIEAYRRFIALKDDSDLQLVLAGEETQTIGERGVIGLGPVDERAKARLIASACAVAQPSTNESFSRVLAESWSHGRPAIVHGDCLATTLPMRETSAGWVATDIVEWQRTLHTVDRMSSEDLARTGTRAAHWIEKNASWAAVLDRYERALEPPSRPIESVSVPIAHISERVSYGDSLTNLMLRMNENLRVRGVQSSAYANDRDPRLGGVVRPPAEVPDDAIRVLYRDGMVDVVPSSGGSAAVHFALNEPALATLRRDHARVDLLPPAFDGDYWNIAPDQSLMSSLRGGTLILSVAPVEAESRLVELLDTFGNFLTFDFEARLAIVGPFVDASYEERLRGTIERMRLENRVFLPGIVSTRALAAFYRSSSIFVCNRERLTTGHSLVDAMAFDLPICCAANDYTRALLGSAGLLVNAASSIELAALWRVLAVDPATRATIVAGQRRRLSSFTIDTALSALQRALEAVT